MSSEPGPQGRSTGEMALVVCFAVFTCVYLYQSLFLERTLISDFIGPARFPQLLAGTAIILCTIYFVQRYLAGRHEPAQRADTDDLKGKLTNLMTLIPIVMYVLLLEPLGFLFATALFVFVAMLFFGQRLVHALAYAVTISITFFVLFYFVLLSQVPMGTVIVTDEVLPFVAGIRRFMEG